MGYSSYVPSEERKEMFLKKAIERGYFDDIELVGSFSRVSDKTEFLCKRCGNIFKTRPSYYFVRRACPYCNPSGDNHKIMSLDDFKKKVKEHGNADNIEILEFISTAQPCKVRCNICGSEFEVKQPSGLYRSDLCKTCLAKRRSEKMSVSKEHFLNKMEEKGNAPDIMLIGKFVNVTTPATFKCLRCGSEFDCAPVRMYEQRNCATCNFEKFYTKHGKSKTISETNKYMFELLNNKEDGYRYTEQSNVKLEWKCKDCGRIVLKSPSDVYKSVTFNCNYCSDTISFPNKVMRSILDCLKVDYTPEATFDWAINSKTNNKYRYDFYIKKFDCIVEMMGPHHKMEVVNWGNSLSEISRRDKEKKKQALENGILNYIEIDSEISDINFIWGNLLKSNFCNIFNFKSLDKDIIYEMSLRSIAVKCWNAWNELSDPTTSNLCEMFKLDKHSVIKYLKAGTILGYCYYNPDAEQKKSMARRFGTLVVYDKNNTKVEEFLSVVDFCEKYGYKRTSVRYYLLKNKEYILKDGYKMRREVIG